MRKFLILIASMPPVSAVRLIPSICLVLVYIGLSQVGGDAFRGNPFILANVVMYLSIFAINWPRVSDRLSKTASPVTNGIIIVLALGIPGSMLIVNDPLYCQRLYSFSSLVFAAALFVGIRFDRSLLTEIPWVGSHFPYGQVNAARIAILGFFMTILLNEIAIRFATQTEWISIRAGLPLLISYLVWVTILATHPQGEETDDN